MSTRTSPLGQHLGQRLGPGAGLDPVLGPGRDRVPRPTTPGDLGDRSQGSQVRLPWWALALPAAAFLVLFALLDAGPAAAGGSGTGAGGAAHLAGALGSLLFRLI